MEAKEWTEQESAAIEIESAAAGKCSGEERLEIAKERAADDDPHVSPSSSDESPSENRDVVEMGDGFCSVRGKKPLGVGEGLVAGELSSVFQKRLPLFKDYIPADRRAVVWPGSPQAELGQVDVSNQQSMFSLWEDVNLRQNGFCVLDSLESDSFESNELPEEPTDSINSNLGKRNRQISTDSSSSAAGIDAKESKSTKKPKKKDRKKQITDEEFDKILAEFNGSNVTSKGNPDEESSGVVETNKRKKNRRKPTLSEPRQHPNDQVCQTIASHDDKEGKANDDRGHSFEASDKLLEGSTLTDGSGDTAKAPEESVESKKHRKKPGKIHLAAIRAALEKAKEMEARLAEEELAKQRRAEEMERARLEKLRLEEERKEKKKQKEKNRKERLKAEGKLLTKSQKVARARLEAALSAWRAHGIEVPSAGGGDHKVPKKKSQAKPGCHGPPGTQDAEALELENQSDGVQQVEYKNFQQDLAVFPTPSGRFPFSHGVRSRARTKSESDLPSGGPVPDRKLSKSTNLQLCDSPAGKQDDSIFRSPVVCVLGHVDTGKTKILDKIRKTHVQDNEAGGITQQIGATMVPIDALREKCSMVENFSNFDLQLPGLLIIDTPGHESFRNLRSRGSSLCDIAVLVVDIMHGLEQQTLESIDLLKQKKTPFVVALNKIDRLYGWKTDAEQDIAEVIRRQGTVTLMEFEKRCQHIIAEFAVQGLNTVLYYENSDPRSYVSMVPVSAVTGDGMGNLLAVVCQLCQKKLGKRLTFSEDLEATVLEVKTVAGMGTTIDVILVNGRLRETDTIVLAGQDGPVVTQIRSLLMPQPLRELRVKNPYLEFKTVKGTQGVKVTGKDLEKAIAGLPLFVSKGPEDIKDLKETVACLYRQTVNSIRLSDRGVYVQASTLGSLEALLAYLKNSNIPYSGVKVGPVVKKDVIRASVMLEHDVQYAAILAFDVKVERDAHELAEQLGIKVFQADIIYHLFDSFVAYRDALQQQRVDELKKFVVFPCKLSVLPECVLSARNPIAIGVRVIAGVLKVGTPLCVPSRNYLFVGSVSAIEAHGKPLDSAREGDDVFVKIEAPAEEVPKVFGRHFDHTDLLVSRISRRTIDVCKEYYRDELQKSDWHLMVELKKLLMIT